MGFDLGALLKDVSGLDTREQIEYICPDRIEDDPENFYQLSNLEELANNIATCGLQQPIRVRIHPEKEGTYIIVSGHRRRAAIRLLAEEDPEKWQQIPCIVERDSVSPSLQQLRLIYANANTRALTPAEISEQAERVEKLLYQLKEEGYEFPGRMRDHVAQAVNASATKLARLKIVRKNLAICWQPAFRAADLAESTAYALAQMPEAWQELIFEAFGDKPRQVYEGAVKEYMKRFSVISRTKCDDTSDGKCPHQLSMMQKSCRDRWSDPCRSGCCKTCAGLSSCRSACSMAASRKKELKEEAQEARAAEAAETARREKPVLDRIRDAYARVGTARKLAGVSVAELYKAQSKFYVESDVAKQVALEEGTAKISTNTPLPYGFSFYAGNAKDLCAVADLLNCSTDYLLGRTEDLRPRGGWMTGNPWNLGWYVVLFRPCREAGLLPMNLYWDGDQWLSGGEPVALEGGSLAGWMEMPEG